MLIDKSLIVEAKEKLGQKAAEIIAKDLQLENFDEVELKSLCPFHKEDSSSFIWNPKNNSYHCFGCQRNYGILDHYISKYHLTYLEAVERLFKETDIKYSFAEKGVKAKDYRYPKREYREDRSSVEKYCLNRGISKDTLDYCDVQSNNHGDIVFHYYNLYDVLSVVKYRPSRPVNKGENKFWAQKDADTKPLLFNMNRIDPGQPLLITEGEMDTLAVIESGFYNSVSVPFGAGNFTWIEENFDWLEQFEKIVVWFDNDTPGLAARKEVCSRLGTWRTFFVDLPEKVKVDEENVVKVKDANDVLYRLGKEKVLEFIEDAHEVPVANVVDLSTVDDFDLESAPGLYSGIQQIDDVVYKFLFGSVLILTGAKGSGKSTLLNQTFICEGLNQGHDIFVFSGELSNSVLKNWIETTMAGRNHIRMKNKFVRIIDKESKQSMREWYKGRIWSFDDSQNNSDVILDRAINVTRRFGVKIWVLDNLMTLDIGATSEGNVYQKQKDFIVKIANLAKTYNVLIILVAHPRKTGEIRRLVADDISGSNDLGNLAQYILGVHRFSEREKQGEKDSRGNYKRGKEPIEHDVAIDVFKNRYTGKIGEVRSYFDYTSCRFYNTSAELWKRYKWDKDTKPIPNNDPNNHGQPDFMNDEG